MAQFHEFTEDGLRNSALVIGNWQATLGDMEHARGGAAIVGRVVQHAVGQDDSWRRRSLENSSASLGSDSARANPAWSSTRVREGIIGLVPVSFR